MGYGRHNSREGREYSANNFSYRDRLIPDASDRLLEAEEIRDIFEYLYRQPIEISLCIDIIKSQNSYVCFSNSDSPKHICNAKDFWMYLRRRHINILSKLDVRNMDSLLHLSQMKRLKDNIVCNYT